MTLQELFSKPDSWCQHALHKTRVRPDSSICTQYCLEGAVIACYGEVNIKASVVKQKLLDAITTVDHGYPYSLPAFNDADRRTIEEIRQVVKVANV